MELNTYLGQKGYTISKNELTIEEQKKIRNDLTIKPFIMGSPINNDQKTFPAYRESNNKFYLNELFEIKNKFVRTSLRLGKNFCFFIYIIKTS